MKVIKCWKLQTIGGAQGEHLYLAGRFSSREEAYKAKLKCGGYGGEVSHETITIFDTAIEWNPPLDEKSKVSGLAKLSDAEKRALNLE